MSVPHEIVLRPRFKIELTEDKETLLKKFDLQTSNSVPFVVTRVDNHVFIKLPERDQHFWSPQLHLEINSFKKNTSTINGLFGPKPSVWTMFMFAHFMVLCVFLVFGVWAYANFSLKKSFSIQLVVMGLMTLTWFVLYFAGRTGKTKGKDEMTALNNFMKNIIEQ